MPMRLSAGARARVARNRGARERLVRFQAVQRVTRPTLGAPPPIPALSLWGARAVRYGADYACPFVRICSNSSWVWQAPHLVQTQSPVCEPR
jgi:hypothetical protein